MKYLNKLPLFLFTIVCNIVLFSFLSSCNATIEPKMLVEEFSDIPTGRLLRYSTSDFTWVGTEGSAEITSKKSKFSPQALRINGGEKQMVIVEPKKKIGQHELMTFWAERWTQRDPFEFRIMGYDNNEWREIFNGDKSIKSGNFSSLVEVPLNGVDYSQYKLICSSPENTGILIDDFRIFNNAPISFDSVSVRHVEVPILKRNINTPVLQIQLHTSGVAGELSLKSIDLDLSRSSNLQDLENLSLVYTGNDPSFKSGEIIAEINQIDEQLSFKKDQIIKQGTNYFWVCATLSESANIGNHIGIDCIGMDINGREVSSAKLKSDGESKLGIALRRHNDNNVDTYRIPGLATTNNGTLIAVYDIRHNNATDLQEDVDIGMNRSTDGGNTWEPMKVIMDMEEWGGLPNDQNGIGDPAILVDQETNTIWVAAVWAHGHPGERNWWASKQGLSPKETSQLMLVKSEDDGVTWSEGINITEQIKDPKWYLLLQGPGKGITLKDGTLVFPAQFKDENEMPFSTIIWSQDHGKTWNIGSGAKENTTEAQVVQRNDGSLMLNMRDNRNRSDISETNGRSVYITEDLGLTWQKHPTSRTNALKESTCQASIIKEDFLVKGKFRSLVLFSNPNTMKGRHHMSIKVSFDDGDSWELSKTLLLDEGHGRGYSCMTKIDDQTIGILYEGSQADMTFQRILISDILVE